MITGFHRETAKIYQFQLRPRTTSGNLRDTNRPTAELSALRISEAISSSWYHEAAIKEDRTSNR